ncbi:MAG: hypothetical protein NTW21_12445 [Verrucomicrobia bacterium]|nr:hypothetical protein [Verrucomicrobiota bacterium]
MTTIYHPRRPRASPLWQIVTAARETIVVGYEKIHRATMGPLRPNVFAVVRNFLRCGDRGCGVPPQAVDGASRAANAAATTPPACHQRHARQTADWISTSVCHEVPHRQFVFTIPKILRGIFHKRRDPLPSCSKRRPTPCSNHSAPASICLMAISPLSPPATPSKAPPPHQAEF